MKYDKKYDPHAELRKTWEPGQRWKWRYSWEYIGGWKDVGKAQPKWLEDREYVQIKRRK